MEWLRTILTKNKLKHLIEDDWREDFRVERVEFPNIKAVHFVIYGFLGGGVCGSPLLDSRGKGLADYIRAKYVDVPESFLNRYTVAR